MDSNIVVFLLIGATALVSYKGFNDISFFRKYEFHIGSIRAGEQYRMFTSAFLHADVMHLVFNMFTLYMFAPAVIIRMGILPFVLVYLGSLICGSLLTLYFHKNEYSYRAIGASGAVTGVVYSGILLFPDMTINFFIPGYIFGIIYLLFSIYGMRAKRDNIGHTAHFGGAVGGYIITLSRMPEIFQEQTFVVVVMAIPILILFVMAKMGKI
ncbi:MAG: rhomboid family intramembrane serine protease [Flavobacterium sp.]